MPFETPTKNATDLLGRLTISSMSGTCPQAPSCYGTRFLAYSGLFLSLFLFIVYITSNAHGLLLLYSRGLRAPGDDGQASKIIEKSYIYVL